MKRATMVFAVGVVALLTRAFAAPITWIGNTGRWLNGLAYPARGGYLESYQSLTVTTQTYPIGPDQRVVAVVSTDGFQTSQEYVFSFDYNVGNNTQWYAVLGPFPKGSKVEYYLRGEGYGGPSVYESNGGSNYGFYTRYQSYHEKGAILQWFSTDYKTILKRLPEVVQAGYSSIYLPPPQKSGGGGNSVGYNPVDRFDLGDRYQLSSLKTQYGTTQELQELITVAHRLGLRVYCDLVLNHNDNRASTAINRYPDMIPEDFHIKSSSDTSNSEINFSNESLFSYGMINYDLVGLADIAHEDGNYTETGPFSLSSYATWNSAGKPSFVRHPATPQYYLNGTPAAEDSREMLRRWCAWLAQTVGFDGFRIDAAKHTPPGYFAWCPDQAASGSFTHGDLLPSLYSTIPNLTIFGEVADTNGYGLKEYAKSGLDLLDFPLFYSLQNLLNQHGFGDLGATLSNGYGIDAATGLAYKNGGLAWDESVAFLQSHDNGPPEANNLGYAFLLSREQVPIVYYDGNNIQPGNWNNFPRPGRGDALGSGSDLITRMTDFRARFGRGTLVNRSSSANLYIYERQVNNSGVALVGLNIRGDLTALTQTVQTSFAAGTVLRDYSGQQPDVTVGSDSKVTITVPSNSTPSVSNNGQGYVLYAPKTPVAVSGTDPVRLYDATRINDRVSTPLPATTITNPAGPYGTAQTFKAVTVTSASLNVTVTCSSDAVSGLLKLDQGLAMAGQNPITGSAENIVDGYVPMKKLANGSFSLAGVDVTGLSDGLHCFRARVFLDTGSRPGQFTEFAQFFYVKRSWSGTVKVDGDLTDLGSAVTTQTRTASSNANRLDALYARNDDQYLYLGLAGRIDTSENFTNGMMLYLDADPSVGLNTLTTLADDSGPAARLISNTKITAPAAFGADLAVGVLRGTPLHSAPEATFIGGTKLTPSIGALSGVFRIDPARLTVMNPIQAAIAYQARTNKTDAAKGYEIAIPLSTIYPNGIGANTKIGFLAALGTTGEANSFLLATDPLRASLGGRPAPNGWLTNQFLPTQSNVVSDPGNGSVSATSTGTINLSFAQDVTSSVTITPGAIISGLRNGPIQQTVTVTNTSSTTISGPVALIVSQLGSVTLLNRTGLSLLNPGASTLLVSNRLIGPGESLTFTLQYSAVPSNPAFSVRAGRGVL